MRFQKDEKRIFFIGIVYTYVFKASLCKKQQQIP